MSDPEYEYKTTSLWLEVTPGEKEVFDLAVARITNKYAGEGWRTVSVIRYLGDVLFILERKIPQNPFDHQTQRDRWHEWEDEKIRRETSG